MYKYIKSSDEISAHLSSEDLEELEEIIDQQCYDAYDNGEFEELQETSTRDPQYKKLLNSCKASVERHVKFVFDEFGDEYSESLVDFVNDSPKFKELFDEYFEKYSSRYL